MDDDYRKVQMMSKWGRLKTLVNLRLSQHFSVKFGYEREARPRQQSIQMYRTSFDTHPGATMLPTFVQTQRLIRYGDQLASIIETFPGRYIGFINFGDGSGIR